MFCPKCGTQNVDVATYCSKCGSPLSSGEPQAQFQPQPILPPSVPNRMTAAIFATVFCWPLGIPAILNASRANNEAAAGHLAEAQQAAKRAKSWIIASFVVPGCIFVVAILAAIAVPIIIEHGSSARASDAKTTINAIWQAAQVYYQDKGDWPATVEELETQKYLEISEATKLQWTFSMVGSPPVTITAVSTERMPGGAGHQVTYNIQDGSWNGYGLPQDEGSQ